jgi:hypothetical protein
MPIPPHTTQRDLVKLALLLCGDRPGAKGTHCSANAEPWQGYAR